MALRGNLQDCGTTQLLNLINLARKTGLLTVQTSTDTARLYFKDGKLVHTHTASEDGHLTSMLVKGDKLTADRASAIAGRSEIGSDRQLGMLLINAGYVTEEDIVQSVTQYMLDIVATLFEWHEGQFEFTADELPSEDRLTVPINLENVIIEGSRRHHENERLQDELPDLDSTALRFTNSSDAGLRSVNLSVEEWRVISFINPRNTIKQIAQANNMDDFQVRKIVYGLVEGGLIELVRPTGVIAPATMAGGGKGVERPPAVKQSVVKGLIGRIRRN
jgi:hypothetical protein